MGDENRPYFMKEKGLQEGDTMIERELDTQSIEGPCDETLFLEKLEVIDLEKYSTFLRGTI